MKFIHSNTLMRVLKREYSNNLDYMRSESFIIKDCRLQQDDIPFYNIQTCNRSDYGYFLTVGHSYEFVRRYYESMKMPMYERLFITE